MLSNKWTFSLTSLVVILVLAFVAPSAMADPFAVTLSVATTEADTAAGNANPDISGVLGDVEVETGTAVNIRILTGLVVNLLGTGSQDPDDEGALAADMARGHFDITAFNSYGGTVDAPELVEIADHPAAAPNGKNFSMQLPAPTGQDAADVTMIIVSLKKDLIEVAHPTVPDVAADRKNAASNVLTIHYVAEEPTAADPTVYSIRRASNLLLPLKAGTENVIILLSEQPREFKKANVSVTEATHVDPVALVAIPEVTGDGGMLSTGRDNKLYPYVLTITPNYVNTNDIVVKVLTFDDMVLPANKYTPHTREDSYVEGTDKLTIKVGAGTPKDAVGGISVSVPENTIIPKDGYLVVAKNVAGSAVRDPGGSDASPVNTGRAPFAQTYNRVEGAIPNLESFLTNGGTIDVAGPKSLVITEIMWGSDASLKDADGKSVPSNSQWIELKNTSGAEIKAAADAYKLIFYAPNETPPAKTAAVAATATALAVPPDLPAGVTDRVGTITDAGAYWSLAGKGQSGRTGEGEGAAALTAVVQTQAIISMYRVADATDELMDGNTAAAWTQSTPPSLNFDPNKIGVRIGSPGRDRLLTAADEAAAIAAAAAKVTADAAAAAKAADTSVSMPKAGQIYISEVMFAGGGSLPQWIEISNGSRSEQVNLSGWTLTVENATADADVSVGSKAVFTIPEGTRIDPSSQSDTPSTILVVTEQGRNNIDDGAKGAGQILNLWTAQQTELILLGVTKRRYSLLSDMAFKVTIAPPTPKAVTPAATETPAAKATRLAAEALASNTRKAATDVIGNLGTAGTATWALPMDEGARSSIIRSHVPVSIGPAAPEAGEMMDSWVLASDTAFADVTHVRASSYYGSADDVGTPGFRAGGALPVELSHFRPARDKVTDAVVITWSTQSELNNAGFFIKRSQQRDGEFQIINATMIQGAGTTSEKQFYTYQDTTAQPNVVYYYQIEDVSLDGNHQTLTRGIRLKGHIGAAGKATVLWGDLKTQE